MKKFFIFLLVFVLFANFCSVSAVDNSASAAIVINARTREVIYSKNADVKRAMASTTKIMTALILAECNQPEKKITVTREMILIEGSSMGLKAGDTVTYNDLLYGILLPSGNDAANVAAFAIAGSVEKFADLMNERAAQLKLKNTHFVTPSGLDADSHYTTAYDLALLTSYALENEEFRKAVSTKSIVLEFGGTKRRLENHNRLLKTYEGAIGVKTGYTSKAGRCLVSAARRGDTEIIAVTLNDRNDWEDHADLLDFGFQNSTEISAVPQIPYEIYCADAKSGSIRLVTAAIGIGVSGNEKLDYITYLPSYLYSPIKSGEIVGYTDVFCGEYKVASLPVFADNDVNSVSDNSFIKQIFHRFLIILRGL